MSADDVVATAEVNLPAPPKLDRDDIRMPVLGPSKRRDWFVRRQVREDEWVHDFPRMVQ